MLSSPNSNHRLETTIYIPSGFRDIFLTIYGLCLGTQRLRERRTFFWDLLWSKLQNRIPFFPEIMTISIRRQAIPARAVVQNRLKSPRGITLLLTISENFWVFLSSISERSVFYPPTNVLKRLQPLGESREKISCSSPISREKVNKVFPVTLVLLREARNCSCNDIYHARGKKYISNSRRCFAVYVFVWNSNSLARNFFRVCVFVSVTRSINNNRGRGMCI